MTGNQTHVKSIAALSLLGGCLGILTGFLFTYALWYMGGVEAELEGWAHPPYWSRDALAYTALSLVVGVLLYGIVFALLTVRFGSPWAVKTRWVVVVCTLLLVFLLVGLPMVMPELCTPRNFSSDGKLAYYIDAIAFMFVGCLPILIIVGPVALLGEWALRVSLRGSVSASGADLLENHGD